MRSKTISFASNPDETPKPRPGMRITPPEEDIERPLKPPRYIKDSYGKWQPNPEREAYDAQQS